MGFQSLPILVPTLIDPLNSTTTPLTSNATFTGTFSNLIAFPVVDVIIITDQPGTLFLDVSSDGITVAQTTSFAVTSTLLFRSPFSWQYIRLRYTNGATAQTTFFLQCILRPVDPGLASLPLNRTVSTNSIAPLNRAVLNAQAPSGFFQNLQCDASNILLVDVSNFPSIQPVSGTVTSNIGTTGGLGLDSSLTTIDTDLKAAQPRKLQDGLGNSITSQVNGIQRALDVGIDVAGVQIDPRSIRTLTSTDTVTANQGTANATPWNENIAQVGGSAVAIAATGIVKVGLTDGVGTSITVGQKVMASSLPVTIASDQSTIITTLGNSIGKSVVMKTGTITTTTATANQVVLTYTVTAGKTFYLEYFDFNNRLTSLPGNNNPVVLGTIALETPSGTQVYIKDSIHNIYSPSTPTLAEPIPIAAGVVIRVTCTPAATSSTIWRANFGGYEK
jgi:hypothetical protein